MEEIEKAANEIINDGTTLGYFDTFAKYEKTGFIKGAKWQEKRMYSEEDLKMSFYAGRNFEQGEQKSWSTYNKFTGNQQPNEELNFEEWFEQLKKKQL